MKFHIYQDIKGEWRWRLVSENGRIVGDSSEGYVEAQNVKDIIKKIAEFLIDEDYLVEEYG